MLIEKLNGNLIDSFVKDFIFKCEEIGIKIEPENIQVFSAYSLTYIRLYFTMRVFYKKMYYIDLFPSIRYMDASKNDFNMRDTQLSDIFSSFYEMVKDSDIFNSFYEMVKKDEKI